MSKVAIAIKSCHRYPDRRQAQLATWLPDVEWDYFYLVGNCPPGVRPSVTDDDRRVLQCDVSDEFPNIAPKIWCAARYALESNITHLFVVDDDTYVCSSRLVQAFRPRLDYVGWVRPEGIPWNGIHLPYMQGSAYWLSERAMEHVVQATDVMRPGVIDDGAVGAALANKVPFTHDYRYECGPEPWRRPMKSNNVITTHKCLPARMHEVHMDWMRSCAI